MSNYPNRKEMSIEGARQGRTVRLAGNSFSAAVASPPAVDESIKDVVKDVLGGTEETKGAWDEWKLSSAAKPPLVRGLNEGQRLLMAPPLRPEQTIEKLGMKASTLLTLMVMMKGLKTPRIDGKPVIFAGTTFEDRFNVPLGNRSAGQVPVIGGIGVSSKRQLFSMTQLLIEKAHDLGKGFTQALKYAEKLEVIKAMKEQPRCIYADTVMSSYVMQAMFPTIHAAKNIFLGDATTFSWMGNDFYALLIRLTDYLPDDASIQERISKCTMAHLSDKHKWDHKVSMLLKAYGLTLAAANVEIDNFFVVMGPEVFASVICPILGVGSDVGVLMHNMLSSGIPLTLLLNTTTHDATTDSFTVFVQANKAGNAYFPLPKYSLPALEVLNCNVKVGDDFLCIYDLYSDYNDRFIDDVWGTTTTGEPSDKFEICQHVMDFENRTLRKEVRRTMGRLAAGVTTVDKLMDSCKSAALLSNQPVICEQTSEIATRLRGMCGMVHKALDHYNKDVRCGAGVFDVNAVDALHKPDHDFAKIFNERRAAREYAMSLPVLKAAFDMN